MGFSEKALIVIISGFLGVLTVKTVKTLTASPPVAQELICAPTVGGERAVLARGFITYEGNNVFKVESDLGGTEYVVKGDMDACAILSQKPTLPVVVEENSA